MGPLAPLATPMHMYTWCSDSLGQRTLIDFCIVSVQLFRHCRTFNSKWV